MAPLKHTTCGRALNFIRFEETFSNETSKDNTRVSKLIGWANPKLIDYLKEAQRNLFIDCTFKIAPKDFAQCMTILVYSRKHSFYVPVFYILLSDKSEEIYKEALRKVVNDRTLKKPIDVATVTMDFEMSLLKAAKAVFGERKYKKKRQQWVGPEYVLCWFHFKQAIKRKLVDLKLPKEVIAMLIGSRSRLVRKDGKHDGTVDNEAAESEEDELPFMRGLIDILTVINPKEIFTVGVKYIRSKMSEFEKQYKDELDKFWQYVKTTWSM